MRSVSDADIRKAFDASVFKGVSTEARDAILGSGRFVALARKEYFLRSDQVERCGLILDGLLRLGRGDAQGHETTLMWARAPQFVGVAAVIGRFSPTVFSQAVTDAHVVDFPVPLIRDLAKRDPSVGWAVAAYSTERLHRAVNSLVLYASGTLRERLQVRLLEAACQTPQDGPLIAPVTQEELAHACGATRSSIARVLHDLREEGAIQMMYRGILIVRPESLAPREPKAA